MGQTDGETDGRIAVSLIAYGGGHNNQKRASAFRRRTAEEERLTYTDRRAMLAANRADSRSRR